MTRVRLTISAELLLQTWLRLPGETMHGTDAAKLAEEVQRQIRAYSLRNGGTR